ncbi:MAG: hypothetical protein H8D56_16905 [Planctomycetes bacterium]|nr:hypothetical protein [Planctomycetota bacterium]MBL7146822.1 hypothetical protein [Phycisphaerae bacterium]
METRINIILRTTLFLLFACSLAFGQTTEKEQMSFKEYIRESVPTRKEIDVFLNEMSWAQFDRDVGYILGNYMPHDGLDKSFTLSTVQSNGARTSFMYKGRPCRINTYGDSFTQCHQVNDGETWQEYLAAHLGEPVRNFGMGGLGVYQAYRRMIREEKTDHDAKYIILYIWGDDHIRSLLRCRYMLIKGWNQQTNRTEGIGKMFHGNFWSNVEMDFETGKLVEKDNLLQSRQSLYKMTDPDWMYETLKSDLALQMYLYKNNQINDIPIQALKRLSKHLGGQLNFDGKNLRPSVAALLDEYAFEATKYILDKADEFASANNKELMVVIFDPYRVTRQLLQGGKRYDREIIDFLNENDTNYIDMNLVHVEDFKSFNLSIDDYFKRYFIGHYSPAGNLFFAYSIKDRIVEWLNPKPITYKGSTRKMIEFKEYLQDY